MTPSKLSTVFAMLTMVMVMGLGVGDWGLEIVLAWSRWPLPRTVSFVSAACWATAPGVASDATLTDGPMGELLQHCAELRDDEQQLRELSEELDDLRRKLPDELRRGEEALPLDDPNRLREVLGEVQSLLVRRLMEETKS